MAIAIGLALASTGCALVDQQDEVVLIGDSLTVLISEEVQASAGDEFDVDPRGNWGKRVDELLDTAASVAVETPDQVFINLGTNNALQSYSLAATREDLESMVQEFNEARCIHLVTVNEQMAPDGDTSSRSKAAAINRSIRELVKSTPHADLVDWNAAIAENGPKRMIEKDSVHPSSKGVQALTEQYVEAMRDC